jgi:hypothetical protein
MVLTPMKLKNSLLMAAFGLLISAFSAQSANTQLATTQAAKTSTIPISYLPYPITAPGTYVLTSNLTPTRTDVPAISIAANISGPVILDLKGFTISGGYGAIAIGDFNSAPNQYPISVKNGTITNFVQGIILSGDYIDLSNLTFSNIQSSSTSSCIIMNPTTNSCAVSNCIFSNALYGIADNSQNSTYTNLQFTNVYIKLFLSASTVEVGRCSMEPSN